MAIPSSFLLIPYTTPSPSATLPITLLTTSSWTHAGPPLNPSSLPSHLHTWLTKTLATGDILPLFIPFLQFLNRYLEETGMDCYTLTIRAQRKTDEFDTPRWHVDKGAFGRDVRFRAPSTPSKESPSKKIEFWKSKSPSKMEGKGESTLKIATALLGPGTLFLSDATLANSLLHRVPAEISSELREDHTCFPLRCLGCADMAREVRFKLARVVESRGMEVVQMRPGELAIFGSERREGMKGGEMGAAWHSEPRIEGDRVFVHVVPGTEGEVRGLMKGWGMEFPRCWSVGVDGR